MLEGQGCWQGAGGGDGGRGTAESLGAMLRGQGMMLGGQGPKAHQVSLPALEIQAAPKLHLNWGGGGGASSGKGDTHVSHPQTQSREAAFSPGTRRSSRQTSEGWLPCQGEQLWGCAGD